MDGIPELPPVFWELHDGLPRQGPGSDGQTRKAYDLLPNLTSPRILDVGCGPGMQTLELARISGGDIVAVDIFDSFLDELRQRARQEGLAERITTANKSMDALDFPDESFDVVWSEGAIYLIGFEKGLMEWKRLIKPGGFLAVTELSWLKDPPVELATYWQEQYPAITAIGENRRAIKGAGYGLIDAFSLPPEAWWKDYYSHIQKRIPALRNKYAGNDESLAFLKAEEEEMRMHKTYSDWYGYVFYVMEKTG